jgi:hypothetical protein
MVMIVTTFTSMVAAVKRQTANIEVLKGRLVQNIHGLNVNALEDSKSYQYSALQRTSEQLNVDTLSDTKIVQYYTLYCIYYATYAVPNEITDADPRFDGIEFPTWLISTHWDRIDVDPCDAWHGITCDDNGRVTAIDLYENTLTGTWPEEVMLLALDGPFSTGAGNLYQIDLYQNEFLSNGDDSSWMSHLGSNMSE